MVTVEILDVTQIEPKLKHPTIFKHFDELETGEGFIIDNDHDPKPLYYQLLGERGNIFTWEYLSQGPMRWQVRIAKRDQSDSGETVGEIAAKDMRKVAVFKEKGIDYSCGGNKTLKEVSAETGIAEAELKSALADAVNRPLSASQNFNEWDIDFLADYISKTHHRYVIDNMEVIGGMAEKVAQHHGEHHPQLIRLEQSVKLFLQSLAVHIRKEEQAVFPIIKQLAAKEFEDSKHVAEPALLKQSALLLEKEHSIFAEDLQYFRKLTNDYQLPEDACNSYAYLYHKLQELENDLQQCMHLENNILFPKVVALERETTAS